MFWRGPLLLSFLVTVFKFGLGFAEPSGSSKVVFSPVLKAKLQPELVTSKHLFTFVQQLEACSLISSSADTTCSPQAGTLEQTWPSFVSSPPLQGELKAINVTGLLRSDLAE